MPRKPKELEPPIPEPALAAGQAYRLKMARAKSGLSLRRLSQRSTVAIGAIQAIERGDGAGAPTCRTIALLADALEVSRGWLAFGEVLPPK